MARRVGWVLALVAFVWSASASAKTPLSGGLSRGQSRLVILSNGTMVRVVGNNAFGYVHGRVGGFVTSGNRLQPKIVRAKPKTDLEKEAEKAKAALLKTAQQSKDSLGSALKRQDQVARKRWLAQERARRARFLGKP